MARTEITATVKSIYSYEAQKYGAYWKTETRYIYTFEAEDGTVYVWKTTVFAGMEVEDPNGWIYEGEKRYRFDKINKGDVIRIAATVKGASEYKGQPQIEINRVKVLERTFEAETWEQIKARKEAEKEARIQAQFDSLKGEDFVWVMEYRRYKEHYSDCETIEDSFNRESQRLCTIAVIIREGRLKASGSRGRQYHSFVFEYMENGEQHRQAFYAICEDNAVRRLKKEHPGATDIALVKQYF